MHLTVLDQALLMGQEAIPGDVPWMGVALEKAPLLPGHLLRVGFAFQVLPRTGATETEHARVAGIMQRVQGDGVGQFLPGDVPAARLPPFGELQALAAKGLHGGPRRTRALEGVEKHPQALADLLVGFQHDVVLLIVHQPDGQRHLEFGALGFVEHAPHQSRLEHVQFGLAHRPLETEQEPVVEVPRIIEPILVQDERVRERADLQQPMPVGTVAGQARDL